MTLQECYSAIGGNYEDVLNRLRNEGLVRKFVLKFLDDPSYELLHAAMEKGNWETAFRGAHTIKGICQNLGFTTLYHSSSKLCDSLRDGYHPEATQLAQQVTRDYEQTITAIRDLQ